MSASEPAPPLSPAKRLGCFLGVGEQHADAALRAGRLREGPGPTAARCGLAQDLVQQLVASPAALVGHRLNANALTRAQADALPGIDPGRVRRVLEGRPYFGFTELEAATGLNDHVLRQLFHFKPLTLRDKLAGRSQALQAVTGQYLVAPAPGDDAADLTADLAESLGFSQAAGRRGAPVRLLRAVEFEATAQISALKAAFGGRVYPVLRDQAGCLRYLVPGSLDVWVRPGVTPARARQLLASLGLRIRLSRPAVGLYQTELLTWPVDDDVTAAVLAKAEEVSAHDEVAFAEPDEVGVDDLGPERVQPVSEFEDAGDAPRDWNLSAIGVEAAHALTTGSPKVTVFVIDSGLRLDHPDLKGALRPDWGSLDLNFEWGLAESETSPAETVVAHGTRVAGIVGGRASSSTSGSRGVAPGCWVLPVKITGSALSGSYGLRAAAILQAVNDLQPAERGVLNISWATSGEHIGIREALMAATTAGFAVATSAGNYASGEPQAADQLHYPSCYAFLPGDSEADVAARRKIPGLCAVAAVDRRGAKASYSYFGARSVSFCAPGGEPGGAGLGIFLASLPENYAYGAGTSFAAPHVAGALALLLSADATLTAQQAVDRLRQSATSVDAQNPSYQGQLGAGLINVAAALGLSPAPSGPGTPATGNSTPPPPPGAKLNINTATATELAALPLMGLWSATRVVDYRAAHAAFASVWDLGLAGLDRWTITQILDRITVDADTSTAPSSDTAPGPNPAPLPDMAGAPPPATSVLDINAASVQALAALPYLGEWTASRIVAHRNGQGPFARVDDLAGRFMDAWTLRQIRHLIVAL